MSPWQPLQWLPSWCPIFNSWWPSDAIWWHKFGSTCGIGLRNGLLLNSTKPLPEPMLNNLCIQLRTISQWVPKLLFYILSLKILLVNELSWVSATDLKIGCLIYGYLLEGDFNSLWPGDAIWWHRSGSTLAQVMACCLMAPSHYLNQYWLVTSKVQWHLSKGNHTRDTSAINY